MLVISTVGFAVMAVTLVLADQLAFVHRWEGARSYFAIGVVVVIAVELRLAVLLAGFDAVGLPNDVALAERVVSSALIALLGYGYAAIALDTWSRYREQRDHLLASLLDTTRKVEGHDAAVSAMTAILRQAVQGRLAQLRPEISRELDELKKVLVDGGDGKAELERVHALTDARWRAISADVWSHANASETRSRWSEFVTIYALSKPFSLPAVLFGGAALAFLVLGRVFDPAVATGALAIWLAIAGVVSLATNVVARRVPRSAVAVVVAAVVTLLSFPAWLVVAGVLTLDDTALLIRIGVINLTVVAVLMAAGASPAVARNRQVVLDSLRRGQDLTSVHQLQVESRLVSVAQELAATLHGSSRSSFMAAALRLEAALDRGDRQQALDLVDDLRRTILSAEHSLHEPHTEATVADIVEVIDNWRSVCDIDVDGSWDGVPAALVPAVHGVVVEAISDAMRHGDCSRIVIALKPRDRALELSITNDGAPVRSSAHPGMGTALLDRLAPGEWSRARNSDGWTQLTVTLHDQVFS